ncbi:MAG TPA: molybdopterin-binding protein [Gammaproteobacteria bacterium]|nr:molybdopterin-binding protein [Gammaproteobacteria bacterium]
MSATPTACVLIIGNEILSGKTQDANLQYLGTELAKLGIKLVEARVVRDDVDAIVAHLNECRAKFSYVFTTGGIGPTHDDITAESIAKAFGVELIVDEEALRRIQRPDRELNEARLKMARIPAGAALIDNPISKAPGFRMENVYVMAGIPSIARAMFEAAADGLRRGKTIHSRAVDVLLRESDLAEALERIALAHPEVEIGSYPFTREGRFGASLVVRGTDEQTVERVLGEIESSMAALEGVAAPQQ